MKKSRAARPQNNSAVSTQATTQRNINVIYFNIQVNLDDWHLSKNSGSYTVVMKKVKIANLKLVIMIRR